MSDVTDQVGATPPRTGPTRGAWLTLIAVLAVVVLLAGVAGGVWLFRGSDTGSGPLVGAPDTASPATSGLPATLAAPVLAIGNPAFDAGMTEVARFVEQTRGLPFKDPVEVLLLDDATFNRLLLSDFDAGIGDLRKTEVALKALGLVPPSDDLVADTRRMLTAGVIGFYDPKSRSLVVRGTDLTPFTKTTLAHELTHALDDQWFNLDRPELEHAGDEALWGFQALTEGSASWVEDAWTKSRPTMEQAQAAAEGQAFASQSDLTGLPPAVVQIIESPYSLGADFVTTLTTRGGTAALDEAFRHPPVSSEQVMHPASYLSGHEPTAVPTPPADAAAVDDGELGELGLVQVLSTGIAPAARSAGRPRMGRRPLRGVARRDRGLVPSRRCRRRLSDRWPGADVGPPVVEPASASSGRDPAVLWDGAPHDLPLSEPARGSARSVGSFCSMPSPCEDGHLSLQRHHARSKEKPMTDAVTTPTPNPETPAPPPAAPAAPATNGKRRGMGAWIALVAVMALLIGAGIGYGAAMPSKNDVSKQRDAAQAQVTQLQSDLSAAQTSGASASSAKDKCSKAATDASDLVKQWNNVMGDISNYMAAASGSATEAELDAHITAQFQTMDAEDAIVTTELAQCQVAVTG